MKQGEKTIGFALFLLILIAWLSLYLHVDSRFPGSFIGGLFGIAAAILILFAFLYTLLKRSQILRRILTKYVSGSTLLTIHIWVGSLGAILALIHSGHRFESTLGMLLTTTLLLVVLSGFIGRYFMTYLSEESREKRITLSGLEQRYREVLHYISQHPQRSALISTIRAPLFLINFKKFAEVDIKMTKEAHDLTESIADLEYALESHSVFKALFKWWSIVHIALSILLLALMTLHIWMSFYYGIRWLQ